MLRRLILISAGAFLPATAIAENMVHLKNQPPNGSLITFQMTDGTVLAQGFTYVDWWKLTPDNQGSYINGTWTRAASLPKGYAPLYFASAVLGDGRLVISGGEYNFGQFAFTNLGAIYDPVADKWSELSHPKGWISIGDSPSVVLPDGRFVVGQKVTKKLASLDPATLNWTALPSDGKNDFNAEEGWTLLPDGSFLTYDVKKNPKSERYFPALGKWVSAGNTVVNLQGPPCCDCIDYNPKKKCYLPPGEVGPAILRPDGTVFATGALHQGGGAAHTSIYSPSKNSWTPGPDIPDHDQLADSYATLLPNGNVLFEGTNSGRLYEFDGKDINWTGLRGNGAFSSLMVLPTGEVLVGATDVFQSTGAYDPAWAPTISSFPSKVKRGVSYPIFGTQFNGLSQANAYGDENETQTNYPLVRIINNSTGHVFYARTHDHSTMGVVTGGAIVSTTFDVPVGTEKGASSLEVVANGIPSAAVAVVVN